MEEEKPFRRKQFTFYESFYHAIEKLPVQYQRKAYKALAKYALYGEESPELPGQIETIICMARPVLRTARRRASAMVEVRKKHSHSAASGTRTGDSKGEIESEKESEIESESESESETEASAAVAALTGALTDDEKREIDRYAEKYGLAAIRAACRQAKRFDARHWAYVRKVLESGAASRMSQFQRHGEPLSPMMIAAARRALEEETEEEEYENANTGGTQH